ncbi:prephenate dehydratase, partial [Candidatus Sumerlaeota bacterium]|nr:prephenate dehydratase [Candidatus Sumerlaeota bacterium]
RQKMVLARVMESSSGRFPRTGLKAVFTEIMSHCLSLEATMKVGYFGQPATFTHIAALTEFGSAAQYEPRDTINDLFMAVEKEELEYAIVPVENSTGGVVHTTLDMFLDYFDARICSEILMAITHNLVARCRLDQVRRVYSNPQPLAQCARWLNRHLPNAERIETATTVQGVQRAAREKGAAAIASELAARTYNLKIVASNIEDSHWNSTRFWVIGRRKCEPTGNDKTSLMFSIKDRPGALMSLLKPFADREINLTKIESRPTRRKAWEYVFFVDIQGHINEPHIREALKEIEPNCVLVRILGSYPSEVRVRTEIGS